jgi:hypothetical protein
MTPQTAILKLRSRLNKISSSDYDNIQDWSAVEAINKAALEISRNIISGNTVTRDGGEETTFRVDDLQFLLKSLKLEGINNVDFYEVALPPDYLWYNRIIPKASKGECKDKPIHSRLVEEANVPVLIRDWTWKPSWEWRETFHTILTDKIRIYTLSEFFVESIDAVYYRKPIKMDISGYTHENGEISDNVNLEFKDDLAEKIIDIAAGIIAGDIESLNQAQINTERTRVNP